jgi:hypothetical protein
MTRQEERDKLQAIVNVVATEFNMSSEKLKIKRRLMEIVEPRQIAQWVADRLLNKHNVGLSKIGAAIGGQGHATVLHSKRAVKNRRETEKGFLLLTDKILRKCQHDILLPEFALDYVSSRIERRHATWAAQLLSKMANIEKHLVADKVIEGFRRADIESNIDAIKKLTGQLADLSQYRDKLVDGIANAVADKTRLIQSQRDNEGQAKKV